MAHQSQCVCACPAILTNRASTLKYTLLSPNDSTHAALVQGTAMPQCACHNDCYTICVRHSLHTGYGDASVRLVEEVMLDRDVPDPRDIRQHDLVAPLGTINFV
jgi:hypothetical protein